MRVIPISRPIQLSPGRLSIDDVVVKNSSHFYRLATHPEMPLSEAVELLGKRAQEALAEQLGTLGLGEDFNIEQLIALSKKREKVSRIY